MTLPAWVEDYRSRPFERGADGPDFYDCYGLVCAVLRERWGAVVPSIDSIHTLADEGRLAAILEPADSPWVACDGGRVGDAIAFRAPGNEAELHVGIVVAPGWMLHARAGVGVETARYERMPWAVLRVAAFRHRDIV